MCCADGQRIDPRSDVTSGLDHAFSAKAFERLWAAGNKQKLVLVGAWGWLSDADKKKIRKHPQMNKQLFHFAKATSPIGFM